MIGDTFPVRNDLDQIAAAFAGTSLAGLPVGHRPRHGVDPDHLYEAWQAADALVPATGRLPVMVSDDFDDMPGIRSEATPGPSESELRVFAEAAESSLPWLSYRHWSDDDVVEEGDVGSSARGMAGVDLTTLVSDVALPAPRQALERWLYDRLLADAALHTRVLGGVQFVTRTSYWYTPDSVRLMLLPTSDVRRSGYWVDFYGALAHEDQQALAEALAQWRLHSARPYASPPRAADESARRRGVV